MPKQKQPAEKAALLPKAKIKKQQRNKQNKSSHANLEDICADFKLMEFHNDFDTDHRRKIFAGEFCLWFTSMKLQIQSSGVSWAAFHGMLAHRTSLPCNPKTKHRM